MPNAHPTPILSLPTDSFTPALARLDPANRALLDLSLRRGMRPEEIGDLLGTDPESVIVAREAALEQLGAELGLDVAPDLDELRARLTTLPGEAWTPAAGEEPEEVPEEADRPQLQVVRDEPEPAAAEPEPSRGRRSRLPLMLTLLAVAAVVLVIVLASGGSDEGDNAPSSSPAPAQKQQPAKKSSKPSKSAPASPEVKLSPIGAAGGVSGTAKLTEGGKGLSLDVKGLPAGAYEVWLYDSVIDAVSIGKGNGPELKLDLKLPANASNYRYVDVSREPADGNPNHSGESVLRVPLVKLSP